MNLLDLAIILALGFFILSGIHRSFLPTVMSLGANMISWACGMIFMPILSDAVRGTKSLFSMLLYYTEGSEYIGDVELAKTSIDSISQAQLNEVVNSSSLPYPFAKEIVQNVESHAFEASGATTLGDYYNETIVCVVVNIISFVMLFVIIRVILGILIEGVDYSIRLPELTQLNAPVSAGFGLLNGVGILFVVFMLVPLLLIVMNFDFVHSLLDNSFFAPLFYHSSWLLSMMPGTC